MRGAKGFDPDVADSVVDGVMDVAPKKPSTSFPMLGDTDLNAMPDPEWLVTDFLVADTLCVLYGAFSTFKSFLRPRLRPLPRHRHPMVRAPGAAMRRPLYRR